MNRLQGGNAPNLLNNMGSASASANNCLINNMQKMLAQGGGSQGFSGAAAGRTLQPQSTPSSQQLRMLVQQIQMAVQAGYLNHQVCYFLQDFAFCYGLPFADIKSAFSSSDFGAFKSIITTNQEFATVTQSAISSSITNFRWET